MSKKPVALPDPKTLLEVQRGSALPGRAELRAPGASLLAALSPTTPPPAEGGPWKASGDAEWETRMQLRRSLDISHLAVQIPPATAYRDWRRADATVETQHVVPSVMRRLLRETAARTRPRIEPEPEPATLAHLDELWLCITRGVWQGVEEHVQRGMRVRSPELQSLIDRQRKAVNMEQVEFAPSVVIGDDEVLALSASYRQKKISMTLDRMMGMLLRPMGGESPNWLLVPLMTDVAVAERKMPSIHGRNLLRFGGYGPLEWVAGDPDDQGAPAVTAQVTEPIHGPWNATIDAALGGMDVGAPLHGADAVGAMPKPGERWTVDARTDYLTSMQMIWAYSLTRRLELYDHLFTVLLKQLLR